MTCRAPAPTRPGRSRETAGPVVPLTLIETFEGAQSGGGFDNPGWTHRILSGPNDWRWSTLWAQSPVHSWLSPSAAAPADRELVAPPFRATADTTLSFLHTYEHDGCFDGATLEVSANEGVTWSVLPDAAFTTGGFNGTISSIYNPLHGLRAWCQGTAGPLTPVAADLSAWAGQDILLRWHAGEDFSVRYLGWFVDDVRIEDAEQVLACQTAEPPATAGLDFHLLPPCRLVDTRMPAGPQGGPALQPSVLRGFAARGSAASRRPPGRWRST